ncbi:hypothetical protein AYR66_00195 [Noviherbaspirillum denitrificans]|uniref:Uncharacterized protein n=1 Tax=Noviherbaspirillum denitrificans TaxID=1968433 RepID=A0A254T7G3_9BURK|nr:hypothetical protein AYR66_00195 [Noviherbaspirillum denitrificans]
MLQSNATCPEPSRARLKRLFIAEKEVFLSEPALLDFPVFDRMMFAWMKSYCRLEIQIFV